jgi:molybdenum cofactor synthesis domain-containing protein
MELLPTSNRSVCLAAIKRGGERAGTALEESMSQDPASPTAAVLIIGDEILSGRTADTNLNTIARFLTALGVDLREARTVADRPEAIIEAVNALRGAYDYVFTTGGIGPTHDDITADCIAEAFGVPLIEHPDAMARNSTRRGGGWLGFRKAEA